MTMFDVLLHFICASRFQCWELHLESLHAIIPYFFSFDMLNNTYMSTVYFSQMMKMQMKDHDPTWDLFESGNFSVKKSSVPFTAIGADHGIEQESCSLRVLGGIKGLTNKQHSLDEYFLTTGQISNILEDFADHFSLWDHQEVTKHYQPTGSKNVNKLLIVLCNCRVSFNNTAFLYNIMTNKVIPPESADKFLGGREIGIQ